MSFGAPQFLWALLLLPLLAGLYLRNETLRVKLLRELVAARLLPDLAAGASAARRGTRYGLALAGLACAIVALAQPRWGYEVEENRHEGLDAIFAIDVSKSMLSTDVTPNRLTRAKFAAQDLLDALPEGRVGLIAFAGAAFVQAPLTIDESAVLASIQDLDTNTIPRGGTDIAAAIHAAADAFGKGESMQHALILFTDGEELEDSAVQAAEEVKGSVRIFTVGVGTREGSLIPVTDENGGTTFLKDAQGQFVKSHLDEERLKQIAETTGGFYLHLEGGSGTVKALVEQGLSKMNRHEFQARETRPIERYEWPLAAGLLLLGASALIGERRRTARRGRALAAAGLAMLLALMPRHASATNAGVEQYDQKDYKGAYDTFQHQLDRDPDSDGLEFDKGTAAYKEGDYDKALESFGKVIGSKNAGLRGQAEYNIGNTLVQRGVLQQDKDQKIKQLTDSLQHYDQALKADPKFADAQYNKDLVRKMIEELKKNPPPQNQQQQQKQQDQKNQQQKQQDQQKQQQQQNQQNQQQQKNQQNQQNQPQQGNSQQSQNQQNQQGQPQQNQQQQQQAQSQQGQQQQPQNQQGQQQQGQQGQGQQQQNGGQGQDQNAQQQPTPSQNGQPSGSPSPGENQQNSNTAQNGENQQGQQQQQQQQANAGGSPTPGEKDLTGEIKAASSPGNDDQKAQAAAARAAATEQSQNGEMTPSQARALIDSLRGEDEHVLLTGTNNNSHEPVLKDW